MIHVFIGTKAQYVKMAPLLQLMDSTGVDYRLIDSGQHADLATSFRSEFGLRDPDFYLSQGQDVTSIPQAMIWASRLTWRLVSHKGLRRDVFGGQDGVCVVHGDTPTTLLGALMACRAGLHVAHVEAGLRTYRWFHPFPEEIVRVLVGRLADVLFAPGPVASSNLRRSGVKGRIVEQSANTVIESLRAFMGKPVTVTESEGHSSGVDASASDAVTSVECVAPVVVTMHRVENLNRRSRLKALVNLVAVIATRRPVRWVMHGPTERAVSGEMRRRLSASGVELIPLVAHSDFLSMIMTAPFVITDGGSIQEECALLGVPTLLWRGRTDREDGLGANVVLSRYDPSVVESFLDDPQRYRHPGHISRVFPSAQILDELERWR